MPSKKKSATDDPTALYEALLATNLAIERKGDANPYTSLNGNMFTLLHQSRLAIRLPEEEREKFLKKYKTTLFEAYGSVMKEYVAVPDDLLEKTKETQEVSGSELRVRQDTQTETHYKEETLTAVPAHLIPRIALFCEPKSPCISRHGR
ncbi:MAG: hypothetical protein ABSG34_05095, partial [Candidatus Sulfotelmatobacter sp.]